MSYSEPFKVWPDSYNERDVLIEGVFMGLGRNLALEKFSGIHKVDPNYET